MRRASLSLSLLLLGCASTSGPTPAKPSADGPAALDASALAPLGIEEVTRGEYAGAERATRSVTALVAGCVRTFHQREPWTRGTVGFHLRVEAPREVRTSGDLADLPVTACISSALGKMVVDDGARGTLDYELTFTGARGAPPPLEGALDLRHVALDWSSVDAAPPPAVASEVAALQADLERCALGAEPKLADAFFAAVRVGGSRSEVVVALSEDPPEAIDCMARRLRATKFTHLGTDYAIGLVARPGARQASWFDLSEEREQRAFAADRDVASSLGLRAARPIEAAPRARPPIRLPPPPPTPVKFPRVELGPASGVDASTAARVDAGMATRRGALRACYQRGLRDNPGIAGTITVGFAVLGDGSLTKLSVSSELDTSTAVCVGEAVKSLRFDDVRNVPSVRYPLRFFEADTADTPDVIERVPLLGAKSVADATVADLTQQLGIRSLPFLAVPSASGASPGVFFRAGDGVAAAFFAQAGTASGAEVCQSSSTGRVLVVRGKGCAPLMKRVLQ